MDLAIIKTGGKQYLVKKGDKIKVEKITAKIGDSIKFDTLLTADSTKGQIELGKPGLASKAEGKVIDQKKAKKISVMKYKSKTRYHRNVGHRQPYSLVEIEKI